MCPPCCRWCFASTTPPFAAIGGCVPRPLSSRVSLCLSLGVCLPTALFLQGCRLFLSPFASKGGIPGVWNLCDHFGSPFFAYVSGCVDVNPRPLSLRTLWYPFLRMTVTSMFYAGVCCLGSTLVYCQSFSHLFRLNGIIKQPTNLNQTWPFLINVIWS